METLRKKLDRLRGRSARGEKVSVDASALLRFADSAIHFLLSAVLAGAVIFGKYAPFGVALVGAAGSGVCGAAALVGACFGYLTLLGFTEGLRYISASMLTFAINFAFYDVKFLRKPWAMPAIAGLLNSITGFIYLSQAGWRTADVIYYFTECFLTVAASWCYRQLLLPLRAGRGEGLRTPQRRVSLAILVCTALMALSSLSIFQDISLGHCAGGHCGPLHGLGRQRNSSVRHGLWPVRSGGRGIPPKKPAGIRPGLCAGQRRGGALDLGQGAARLHFI